MYTYTKGLHQIADGVQAWLLPDGSWGWSNAGLITGNGESMLVDTLFDLVLTQEMLDAFEPFTRSAPIEHLVNTHANGDHCFGNQLVPAGTRIYAGPHFNEELHSVDPRTFAALADAQTDPGIAAYLHGAFDPFRLEDVQPREATVVVERFLSVDVGGRRVDLQQLGPAHTSSDVIAWVPDSGVLFTGDLLFIGGTPIVWAGPAQAWADACDAMLALNPRTVVPGHGPITGADGIKDVQDYLRFVSQYAAESYAAGRSWAEAAERIDLGPFAKLGNSERIVANLYTEYCHLDPAVPRLPLEDLIVEMARWYVRRR